jgi:hypothetical protein
MQRAARWDGVFPLQAGLGFKKMVSPDTMRAIAEYVRRYRLADGQFDLVHWGISDGDNPEDRAAVLDYQDAGVTWWLENVNAGRGSVARMRERIRKGPPIAE